MECQKKVGTSIGFILTVFVDDCIIISKKGSDNAKRLIVSLKGGNKESQFTDEGSLDMHIRVGIKET